MKLKNKKNSSFRNNWEFIDSLLMNDLTFQDYLDRFEKVALSVFEWVNLPKSMDARYLERTLYYDGQATLLKDGNYGFINTRCCSNGYVNIYGLPSSFNCYSFEYQSNRKLYTGLKGRSEKQIKYLETSECILVQNNWSRVPTCATMELFAYRLYEAEMSAFTNIKAQKTPILLLADDTQKLTLKNLYEKYDGNQPFIFGDKKQLAKDTLQAIRTDAPFVADKIMQYKKEIWNEALTYLGINNIIVDKKERLITDEANSNNELINLNLESYLAPRKEACKQFNEKFGFTGTDKEISVRVRSDLHNVIKNLESSTSDLTKNLELINNKGVVENG